MIRTTIFASLLALSTTVALAQPGPGRNPPSPDADKDGKVTLVEFKAAQNQRQGRMFDRMDADGDGKITQTEADAMARRAEAAGRGAPGGPGVMGLDANKDGAVTRAEMDAMTERRFKSADADSDGSLSQDELAKTRQGMRGGPGPG
jgi:Ca2+-binding EF-hand superfamily protein